MSKSHSAQSTLSLPHLAGLFGGAICIAFAPIFTVLAGTKGDVGMLDAAFWRVFLGAVTMGLVLGGQALIRHRSLVAEKERLPRLAVDDQPLGERANWGWWWVPGLFFAGDFGVWHWSFVHTSVANSTLLANTAIVIVTLFAWLVWKEKITTKFVGGAVLAFTGAVALMISSARREPPAAGNPVFGDVLALATAFFYASYQLSMKWYRQRRSAPLLMFWASAISAAILLPFALWHSDRFLSTTAEGWWALVGVGVVSHAAGQGLIAWSLVGLRASLATVGLLLQPVATALLGATILGQPLVGLQIAGGVVVLAGLFVAVRGRAR
jgi:drug/metabolite transporter (DMT)-like permease